MPPRMKKKQEKDQTPRALLREKLFVPCEYVTEEHLKAWTAFVPDPDKPDIEDKIELQLYKDLGRVYAFCSGDLSKVRKYFSPPEFKLIDKRVAPEMDHPISMTSDLYTPETDPQDAERNQQEVSDEWIKYGYGQIQAPARFGKTITISNIVCRLGLKTLILSHAWDILDQFERTIREHTDVEAIEKMVGRKLVARLDKWDWERLGELDIVLSSWQAWWHPSKRHYLKQYRDQFGIVLIDESHLSSPPCYSRVVNAFSAKYRCGNTATPFKLSELHVVIENIVGPVVTRGHSEQMKCIVNYVHTDIEVEKFPRNGWAVMIKRLVTNEARNQLIVDEAVSDAKDGRHILITTDRVAHAKELAGFINAEGITAISVTGDTTARDALWDRARSGEVQVVVAMRRITRLGIDVPLWDTFYNVLPTSDPYNYYQELSRIRTRYKGKPTPLIKDFIDDPDPEVRAAIIGTMTKRNQVYLEQGFEVKNAAFKPRKPKRLTWGRRTRKDENA